MRPGDKINGRYYVDMGQGYLLLERDGQWLAIISNASTWGTLTAFLKDLSDRSAWGTTTPSCHRLVNNGNTTIDCDAYVTQGTCEAHTECYWGQGDEERRFEFTMIILIFFGLAIVGSALNIVYPFDLQYPGIFIWGVTLMFFVLSIVGQFDSLSNPQGVLYIYGATGWPWFDNYIVFFWSFVFSVITALKVNKEGR
jgi:hypothetical protein